MKLTGDDQLYFYDAIATIIAADSIDQSIAFGPRATERRRRLSELPLTPDEYAHFQEA
jgi:folate-dependent tRNA-U54 methylase TrmFO/GidA